MTIISRINETISDHSTAANIIAFGVLATVTSISAAAINYSGDLTKASYDTLSLTTATIAPVETSKAPAKPQASTVATGMTLTATSAKQTMPLTAPTAVQGLPLTASDAKQNLQGDAIGRLQPVQGIKFNNDINANSLHPSTNGIQLTGEAPQSASGNL